MTKIRNICNPEVAENWWDYYLVKYGIREKSTLLLETKPHQMSFALDSYIINNRKDSLKTIFLLIREDRIKYDKQINTMVIYSKNRTKKEFKFGIQPIDNIDNIERILNVCDDFEEYNDDFFLVEIRNNVKFLIRKRYLSDIGILEENFIKNQYATLYPYLKDATVLDIGGYIGDSSILFCLKGAKQVYTYEPHPELYNMALLNIRLNKLESKIIAENYGVGQQETVRYIKEDQSYGATAAFGLIECPKGKKLMIKIKPLQKIIENINRIDVLKMDCEGAEFDAILSCPHRYLKKTKVMLIEYHSNPLTLIDYLKKAQFEVKIIKENNYKNNLIGLLLATQKKESV